MHTTSRQTTRAKREIFPPLKDLMNRTPDIPTDQEREEQSKASSNVPQKMALLVEQIHKFLQKRTVFSSFPMSLSLIGFEELMDLKFFVCPCRHDLNIWLTVSIFIGPPFIIFALMYLVLRPCKHYGFRCSQEENDDTQQNWPKALAHCLMPSLMWVIILLLDGDYVACAMTDWKGVYVFDQELNRSWCKPAAEMRNEAELRDMIRQNIYYSRISGYCLSLALSVLTITLMVIYDCCTSGKCDCCPKRVLSCFRRTAKTQSEEEGAATMGQELQEAGSSAKVHWFGSSAKMGHGQQRSGSSAPMSSATRTPERENLLPDQNPLTDQRQ
ncbi:uncharacterized protein LOC107665500 [Sinocyclocheilus anshuiensis]|uniref:uncharacterized protein LOC107665500 n=1 Tax=Sinocyclocheilus anshuiensis TaxID=1608454 RepID=UPI0007BA70E1|nr:PREDICTED: uncharacterized protein LOC107665500 [Sinocyclocheilus anshuiensis]